MKDQTINSNIRHLLMVHNMSASDLAEKLNISPQAVSKWLSKSSPHAPTVFNIVRIADIFGVSTDQILKTDLSTGEKSQAQEESFEDRIDAAILSLERLKDELLKKPGEVANLLAGKTRSRKRPEHSALSLV